MKIRIKRIGEKLEKKLSKAIEENWKVEVHQDWNPTGQDVATTVEKAWQQDRLLVVKNETLDIAGNSIPTIVGRIRFFDDERPKRMVLAIFPYPLQIEEVWDMFYSYIIRTTEKIVNGGKEKEE